MGLLGIESYPAIKDPGRSSQLIFECTQIGSKWNKMRFQLSRNLVEYHDITCAHLKRGWCYEYLCKLNYLEKLSENPNFTLKYFGFVDKKFIQSFLFIWQFLDESTKRYESI